MQDTLSTTVTEPTRFQCRHIHADGRQCGSVSLRNEKLCYFHHTTRVPIRNARERKGRRSTFDLPLIEDRSSILRAISEIITRISTNEVDPRRAGLLLYGLQIAVIALPKQPTVTENTPIAPTVEEVTIDPELGQLAPQIEFSEHTRNGTHELNLEEILMQDWARQEEYERLDAETRDQVESQPVDRRPYWDGDPQDPPVPRIQAVAQPVQEEVEPPLRRNAKTTASSGGASNTPHGGIRTPSTIGPSNPAHHGTIVVRFRINGEITSPSSTAINPYSPSTMHTRKSRSSAPPETLAAIAGPTTASIPPNPGTNWNTPPSSAHNGAQGTRNISSPISQSTPTISASSVTARPQFASAPPAVLSEELRSPNLGGGVALIATSPSLAWMRISAHSLLGLNHEIRRPRLPRL